MKLNSFIASAALLAIGVVAGALHSAVVTPGSLIKASAPAVYYVGADSKRYVFPNDKIYFSWYQDFSQVTKVTDAELADYTIGGNVTYRPGVRLVKIQSDPKVYAVSAGGVLRWVKTEAAAGALFGANWSKQVDDLSDSFFVNYTVGADVSSAGDYNLSSEQQSDQTINADKGLVAVLPPTNTNANTNTNVPATAACANACVLGSACVANVCKDVPGPSAMAVKAFVFDYIDTCFVGDPCTGGACCTVDGNQFADNANLKAVRPDDKYIYANKQQLCGRASVSAQDRTRLTSELNDFAAAVSTGASNRMSAAVSLTRLAGQTTMSRLPGSCNWWISPGDIHDRLGPQTDSTTDAVFVISSRNFDFGTVPTPDIQTVDQSAGLGGAGYSYLVKEWETDTSGAPDHSAYTAAFESQMSSSLDLNVSDPAKSFIGNHCRDNKKDFDETGLDCGGSACTPCIY